MYVYILIISPFSHKVNEKSLSDIIYKNFNVPTIIKEQKIDLSFSYDPLRNQYNSSKILYKLLEILPKDALSLLGLTDVDLFIPIFTYVFGEAQLDGKVGIVSIHRLKNELYGLPGNPSKLQERLEKEVIHELGHNFGLLHCENYCVMRASNYMEEIDLKPLYLCKNCREFIEEKISKIFKNSQK
ncbi:MAG: archaemetzincin [candidate division WOR-3 bacterium]